MKQSTKRNVYYLKLVPRKNLSKNKFHRLVNKVEFSGYNFGSFSVASQEQSKEFAALLFEPQTTPGIRPDAADRLYQAKVLLDGFSIDAQVYDPDKEDVRKVQVTPFQEDVRKQIVRGHKQSFQFILAPDCICGQEFFLSKTYRWKGE